MNKTYTPFGIVPAQYLEGVALSGGLKWDDELEEWLVLAESKNGKEYRTGKTLQGIITEGSNKSYCICPQFEAMKNYANRKGHNWFVNIDLGEEEDRIIREMRKKSVNNSSGSNDDLDF